MSSNVEDIGKLLLRLVVGGLILLHGTHKLLYGIDPIRGMVTAHGLPAVFAYGVFLGEVVGPVLVIAGVLSRLGGWLIVANMVVAVFLAHSGKLFTLNPMGGWSLELEAFYLFDGLLVALLGAGRWSLGGAKGKWN